MAEDTVEVRDVRDRELDWIRRDTAAGRTIRSIVPGGYECYAVLDLDGDADHERSDDVALLDVLAAVRAQPMIAGWIVKSVVATEIGAEHRLYAGWPYRLRFIDVGELRDRVEGDREDAIPDLLFPDDRSWIVSTAWDDSWRSIGAPRPALTALAARSDRLELIDPATDIGTTGRTLR